MGPAVHLVSGIPFKENTLSTPAQQAANATNAQFSTGPKTPEGKQRSAHNALKHGLTAREVVIRDGEHEEFESLQASLGEQINPDGALEQLAFDQLLHSAWNLRRLRLLEAETPECANPFLDDSAGKVLDRHARYCLRTERSYYRALRELRTLQTDRALGWVFQLPIPLLANVSEWLKRTQSGEMFPMPPPIPHPAAPSDGKPAPAPTPETTKRTQSGPAAPAPAPETTKRTQTEPLSSGFGAPPAAKNGQNTPEAARQGLNR